MEDLIIYIQENYLEGLKYFSIPIVAGIIGWFTNMVAIKMTFYPLEFFGIKLGRLKIGWQGIIPSKAPKMASIATDLMTTKVLSVEDIFSKLEPYQVAIEMQPSINRLAREIADEVMNENAPMVWARTPDQVKDAVYNQVSQDLPAIIEEIMTEVKVNINDLFDLKHLVIQAMLRDRTIINEIFMKCGKEEFKFIERSGFWFGMLFGLVQMAVWYFYKGAWVLPVFGVIVGYATNWLALKLIFEPLQPKRIGPWVIQGLFIKRQKEVSDEYGKVIGKRILNSNNILEHLIHGANSDKLVLLVEKHVAGAVNRMSNIMIQFAEWFLGPERIDAIKGHVIKRIVEEMPTPMKNVSGYADETFDIENMLSSRLGSLPPDEFVGVLRPAFQEEEFILILVGAALGGVAGLFQYLVVFM
jgi:uncharacterized membrane protein YheB (UPF0754 family)